MTPLSRSILVVLLLLGTAASAEEATSDDSPAEGAAGRFPQPVRVGSLLGRTVLEPLESQPTLGHVDRVVRQGDGALKVVISYGGVFGFGSRPIAVPVEAMVLLGQYMEVVDFTPTQLDQFPTFVAAGTSLVASDAEIKVGLARPSH